MATRSRTPTGSFIGIDGLQTSRGHPLVDQAARLPIAPASFPVSFEGERNQGVIEFLRVLTCHRRIAETSYGPISAQTPFRAVRKRRRWRRLPNEKSLAAGLPYRTFPEPLEREARGEATPPPMPSLPTIKHLMFLAHRQPPTRSPSSASPIAKCDGNGLVVGSGHLVIEAVSPFAVGVLGRLMAPAQE